MPSIRSASCQPFIECSFPRALVAVQAGFRTRHITTVAITAVRRNTTRSTTCTSWVVIYVYQFSLYHFFVQLKLPPMPEVYSVQLKTLIKAMMQRVPERRPSVDRVIKDSFIQKHIAMFLKETRKSHAWVAVAAAMLSSAIVVVCADVVCNCCCCCCWCCLKLLLLQLLSSLMKCSFSPHQFKTRSRQRWPGQKSKTPFIQ